MTSHATIHGKDVPGKGLKIKLTNQPVEFEKIWLTVSSTDCANAGAVPIRPSPAAAPAAREIVRYMECSLSLSGIYGTMLHGTGAVCTSALATDPKARAPQAEWPLRPIKIWPALFSLAMSHSTSAMRP